MSEQGGRSRPSSARSVNSVSPRRTRSSASDSVRTSDGRRSILTDSTHIDVPGRKSWHKRIKNSIDKIDVMNNVAAEENFDIENIFQASAGPSQLRKLGINMDNMSESSTSESLASIQIPQRKLFTHRQTQHLEKKNINKKTTQEQVESDSCNESLGSIQIRQRNLFTHKQTKQADVKIIKKPESLRKDISEKTIHLPKKDLFRKDKEMGQNKAFPVSINVTTNATKNNKVDSSVAVDTGVLKKNLFGKRQAKQPAALPVSLMSESGDDTLEMQERLTALKKNPLTMNRSRRISAGSRSGKRTLSNASFYSETMELENWKCLPSSTVIGEDIIASTPKKKICRNKIQDDIIEDNLDVVDYDNVVTEVQYTDAKELQIRTSKLEHEHSSKVQHSNCSNIKDQNYSKLEQRDFSQEKLNNTLKTQTRNQSKLNQQDDSKIKHKNTSNFQDTDNSKLLERNGDSKAENKNISNMQLRNRSKLEQTDNSKEQKNMFTELNDDEELEISKVYVEKIIEELVEEVDMAQVSENISYKNNETNKEKNDQVEATETDIDDTEEDKSVIRSEAESDYDQQKESNNESEIEDNNQENENVNMNKISDQAQIKETENDEINNTKEELQVGDVEMENVIEDHTNKENAVGNKLLDQYYEHNEKKSDDLDNEPEVEQNENQEDQNISDHNDGNYEIEEQNYSQEHQNTSDHDDDEHNKTEDEQNEIKEHENISDNDDDEHNETEVEENESKEDENISDNDEIENNVTKVENESQENQNNSNCDDDENKSEVEQNESQEDQDISENDGDGNNETEVENESQENQNNSNCDHDDDDNKSEVEHNETQEDQDISDHNDDDDGNDDTEVEHNDTQKDQNISDHDDGDDDDDDNGNDETEVEHNDSQEDRNISDHNDDDDNGNYETEVKHNDSQEDQNISYHHDDDDNGNDEIDVEENMRQEEQDDSELSDEQNDAEDRMNTAEDVPADNLSDEDNFRVVSFKNRNDDTLSKSRGERVLRDQTIDVKKSSKSQKNSINFFKNISVDKLEIDPGRMCGVEHSNRCSAEFFKNMSNQARSSTESSGWNSHTTAYIQRAEQTMKERKSLRTLVLDKNAKVRPSTKEIENSVNDEHDFTRPPTPTQVFNYSSTLNESDTNKSMNRTQTKITTYLRNIAQENLEFRQKIQKSIKKSIRNTVRNPDLNFQQTYFQYSDQPNPTSPNEILKTRKSKKGNQNNFLNVVVDRKMSKPPKATWITMDLYKFLHAKIQPSTDVRCRAEMFVRLLLEMYKLCLKRTTDVRSSINVLKKKMAVMRLINTHFDFYKFVEDFMPKEFRLKVIPDIINNLPVPVDIYASIIPPDNINRS